MTSANRLTDQDYELLSAYLDNELGVSQRAALEMRLAADPALAGAYDELRRTLQIVRSAPRLMPPRNFTLDPARFGSHAPRRVGWTGRTGYRTLQFVGALGSAAAMLLIVLGFALTGFNATAPSGAPAAANVALQMTSTLLVNYAATQTVSSKDAAGEATIPLEETEAAGTTLANPELSAPSPANGAETGAANGFAAAATATFTPSATLLPTNVPATIRGLLTPTLDILSVPSGGGSGGGASGGAPPSPANAQPGAMAGAAQVPPAQPSASLADAASAAQNSAADANKVDLATPTQIPTATSTATMTATNTYTVTPSPDDLVAKANRESTAVALAPTAVEQQGQDAANAPSQKGTINTATIVSLPAVLLITGISLLILSAMVAGVGVIMARKGRNR